MREIVLDTETTGLDPANGDRIVEIGAVELINHVRTDKKYHQYINPQRDMPADAFAIHGLSDEFLSKKPIFKNIVADFLSFIGDSPLVIHNAAFDMRFINSELSREKIDPLPWDRAVDTLKIARQKFPGSPSSLDALCRRFNIDNSARDLHGALLDSEILADVYLELIGGRQPGLSLQVEKNQPAQAQKAVSRPAIRARPLPSLLTPEEENRHSQFVEKVIHNSLWNEKP